MNTNVNYYISAFDKHGKRLASNILNNARDDKEIKKNSESLKKIDGVEVIEKDAQNELERADKTTRHLKHTTGTNKKLIDECTGITDRMSERARSIQAIIRNAETANQADGTQTNCNP